jgi:hypothetical protein
MFKNLFEYFSYWKYTIKLIAIINFIYLVYLSVSLLISQLSHVQALLVRLGYHQYGNKNQLQ